MELQMIGDENTQPNEGVTLESLAEQLSGEEGAPAEEGGEAPELAEEGEQEEAAGEDAPDGGEEADEAEEEPDVYEFTVKHDGKESNLKLTHAEVVESIQKSLDYTQKTMALAEERKAIEPLKREAEQFRQQTNEALTEAINRLDGYAKFLQAQIGSPPPITLASTDAGSYLAQKELYEARKGQLDTVLSESRALVEEQARQRQAYVNHKATQAEKALKDTLPGWDDAMLTELAGYADSFGLNPGSADMAMLEPGFWQMAQKAKAYDALQAEKAKLKPVNQLPKVHKPSANNQPPQLARRQEAIKRHKANPSVDSLAALL
jgi:hypothetical protein